MGDDHGQNFTYQHSALELADWWDPLPQLLTPYLKV